MAHYFVRQLIVVAELAGLVVSCGKGDSGSNSSRLFTPDIQAISDAVGTGAHSPASAIDLTSSPIRLRISVRDATLATADEATRNNAAAANVYLGPDFNRRTT